MEWRQHRRRGGLAVFLDQRWLCFRARLLFVHQWIFPLTGKSPEGMGRPSDGTRDIKGPLAGIVQILLSASRRGLIGRRRMPYRLPYRLPRRLPCSKPPADPAVGGLPPNGDIGLCSTADVPASSCSLRKVAVGASGQIGTAPLGGLRGPCLETVQTQQTPT